MARRTDLVLDEAVDPLEVLACLQVGGGRREEYCV